MKISNSNSKSNSNQSQDSNNAGKSSRLSTIAEIVRRRNTEKKNVDESEFASEFAKLCREWGVV